MSRLVLLRHGQSPWNRDNLFTGWADVDLTVEGMEEARRAGEFLREAGLTFDIAYTSMLKRAIRSLWLAMEALDCLWLPVVKCWKLNERHYGALQGLSKNEMVDRYGPEQVFQWRRSYRVRPPALSLEDPRHPVHDPRYAGIDPLLLPAAESLADTLERVLPYWQGEILPRLQRGERVLVVAHGNSLRALVTYLEAIPEQDVPGLSIPTGIPMVYDLDEDLHPVGRTFLGNPELVRAAREKAAKAAQVRGAGKNES